jgi:hypothetical protein
MQDSRTDVGADWPSRYCARCDTTLRAPTWRRLATMNGRHHMIKKGHLFTRCMELRIQRRADQRAAEQETLIEAILKAPAVVQDDVVMYEIIGPGLERPTWHE